MRLLHCFQCSSAAEAPKKLTAIEQKSDLANAAEEIKRLRQENELLKQSMEAISSPRSGTSNLNCAKFGKPRRGHAVGSSPSPPLRRLLAAIPQSAAVLHDDRVILERAFREDERLQAKFTQHDSSGLSEMSLAKITASLAQQQERKDMIVPSMDISTFVGSDISNTSFSTLSSGRADPLCVGRSLTEDTIASFVDNDSSCLTCALTEPDTTAVHSGDDTCSCNGHVDTSHMHPERVAVSKTPSVPERRELQVTMREKGLPAVSGVMQRGVLQDDKNNVMQLLSYQLF